MNCVAWSDYIRSQKRRITVNVVFDIMKPFYDFSAHILMRLSSVCLFVCFSFLFFLFVCLFVCFSFLFALLCFVLFCVVLFCCVNLCVKMSVSV